MASISSTDAPFPLLTLMVFAVPGADAGEHHHDESGPSKTLATAAALLGLGWKIGALIGIAAMANDLLASFVKRRLGLPPSSRAIGLDQIPESLIPLLACRLLLPITEPDVAIVTILFFAGELVLSRLLFRWHLRDRPY
jgi:CDP-archaeol synthase